VTGALVVMDGDSMPSRVVTERPSPSNPRTVPTGFVVVRVHGRAEAKRR